MLPPGGLSAHAHRRDAAGLSRRGDAVAARPGSYQFALTREGWLQPWARLRAQEEEERQRLGAMPAFRVLNAVRHAKPGASVVATVRDVRGPEFPALAVQRFGEGRTAAVLVGDLWRWGCATPIRAATWKRLGGNSRAGW